MAFQEFLSFSEYLIGIVSTPEISGQFCIIPYHSVGISEFDAVGLLGTRFTPYEFEKKKMSDLFGSERQRQSSNNSTN